MVLLLACVSRQQVPPAEAPDTDTDTDTDTATDGTGDSADYGSAYDEAGRTLAFEAALYRAPAAWVAWNALFDRATASDCPAREERDGAQALVGGCTDEGETWTGEVVRTVTGDHTVLAFAGLTHEEGSDVVTREGTQDLDAGSGAFVTALATVSTGSEVFDLRYEGWTLAYPEWESWWANRAASWAASGTIEIVGVDTWSCDIHVEHQARCLREPDAGSIVLTGARGTLTFTFDGASACDGEVGWTEGELSGTLILP